MEGLGPTWCLCFAFIAAGMCYGQDTCEVIPKNLTVKLGSNVTVVFRAPLDSICRKNWNSFRPSKVFWTLNSKKIEESYYTHNSTYAVVTIVNFTLQSGTVECHLHEQVLGGTIVRTQVASKSDRMEPPEKPFNIHCVINPTILFNQYMICYWDEAGNSPNTTYKVTMEQKEIRHCTSQHGQNHCRLSIDPFEENMTVTVTAQNSVGNASATVHFVSWEISKYDPPKGIQVKSLPTGLRVEWDKNNYPFPEEMEKCEAQCVEEGTNVKIVSHKITPLERAIFVGDVKPCTRYTVVVRCAYSHNKASSLWSDWSIETTVMSTLNVSTVPFYLWGKVPEQERTRHVQLMWKGPPPYCKAFDEYRLSVDSGSSWKHLNSSQHHATVVLSAPHHEITIAIYKNSTMLRHSSLKIPFTGKDMPPVQKPIATALGGLIHVSWNAPSTPVKYYVIEWFTDPTQADRPSWSRTQDTNISLPGDLPYKLYTVTITPLYDDGPGQRSTIFAYAKQGAPAKVEQVKKIEADATWLKVEWKAVRPDQCCGFVVNYTVFYSVSVEKQLNVTVNHPNQQVTLRNLHPNTMYRIQVRANSIDNSSDSESHTLKTEAYGKAFIKTLVYVGFGLILLLVIAVCIFVVKRKVVNLMVPNPQFSSMAMWAPEMSLKPSISDHLGLDNSHKERILLCQVDTEMDTKMASAADTDSTLSHPMEDGTDGASVALDTSSRQAESSGGIVLYSIWECQTKSPAEAVEPIHQQPDQASPSPRNPYLNQMAVCGNRGLLTAQALGPNMPDEGKTVVELSEQEPLKPAPSATTYVTVDMFDGQKEA